MVQLPFLTVFLPDLKSNFSVTDDCGITKWISQRERDDVHLGACLDFAAYLSPKSHTEDNSGGSKVRKAWRWPKENIKACR
jgi:hypothetical protein